MVGIRVIVAEDHALLRDGLSRLIEADPDLRVTGVAADLPELLAVAQAQAPDVVVTDIRMPPTGTDEGIRAAQWLHDNMPAVGVVVLSQFAAPGYAVALLERGSARRAYLLKERVTSRELASAIKAVAQGGSVIDSLVVEELVRPHAGTSPTALSALTARESDILAHMAEGKNNAAIAAGLVITERAVEKHTNSIFAKLGLAEASDVNRRVRAVLVYLAEHAAPLPEQTAADGRRWVNGHPSGR